MRTEQQPENPQSEGDSESLVEDSDQMPVAEPAPDVRADTHDLPQEPSEDASDHGRDTVTAPPDQPPVLNEELVRGEQTGPSVTHEEGEPQGEAKSLTEQLAAARLQYLKALRIRGAVTRGRFGRVFGSRFEVDGNKSHLSGKKGAKDFEAIRTEYQDTLAAYRKEQMRYQYELLQKPDTATGEQKKDEEVRVQLLEHMLKIVEEEDLEIDKNAVEGLDANNAEKITNWMRTHTKTRMVAGAALAGLAMTGVGGVAVAGARVMFNTVGSYIGTSAALERFNVLGIKSLSHKGKIEESYKRLSARQAQDTAAHEELIAKWDEKDVKTEMARMRIYRVLKGTALEQSSVLGDKATALIQALRKRESSILQKEINELLAEQSPEEAKFSVCMERLATEAEVRNRAVENENEDERIKKMHRKLVAGGVAVLSGGFVAYRGGLIKVSDGSSGLFASLFSGNEDEVLSKSADAQKARLTPDVTESNASKAGGALDARSGATTDTTARGGSTLEADSVGKTVTPEAGTDGAGTKHTVTVEIRKGEGMIKALGRTLAEKNGLSHERAMELANKIWAKNNPEQWFNLVHEGDTFKLDIPEAFKNLNTADIASTAEAFDYNPDNFSYEASGIQPEHDLPHGPRAGGVQDAVVAPAVETPLPAVEPELHVSGLAELNSRQFQVDAGASAFIEKNRFHFNPNTYEFSWEAAPPGVSAQSHVLRLTNYESRINIDHVKMTTSGNGNLLVELFHADNPTMSDVVEIGPDGVINAHESSSAIILDGNIADKLYKNFAKTDAILDTLSKKHPSIGEKLGSLLAQDAAGDKKNFIKQLQSQLGLSRGEAKKLAKPLCQAFERLVRDEGLTFGPHDTIREIHTRLEFRS